MTRDAFFSYLRKSSVTHYTFAKVVGQPFPLDTLCGRINTHAVYSSTVDCMRCCVLPFS